MLKPLAAGIYCPSARKSIGLTEWKHPKDDGRYQWLDMTPVDLPKTAFFLYITRNWCLQVGPGVPELYGAKCRIRLHVRFAEEGFYTDRVVFIPETTQLETAK
ncbi:MAG: hypothetical protein PHG71_08150 [Kiritimatiellae bacterium]|nr:hypothetical protein [Kiritimatiellia bacterium]MDD4623193.1 hypothetical protein [Kiritimatiellia bacterium]